jgi:hypothetical protein
VEDLPFPRLLSLLDYWAEWPPASELLRGYVGYKPLSKEERERRSQAARQEATRAFGPAVNYEQLPQWLREAHQKKQNSPKPPSGG